MMPVLSEPVSHSSWNQQRRVTITEEPELMGKGIIVDLTPVTFDKSADQQQERRLRLMEISNKHLDYLVVVAWHDNNLRAAMQDLQRVPIHP